MESYKVLARVQDSRSRFKNYERNINCLGTEKVVRLGQPGGNDVSIRLNMIGSLQSTPLKLREGELLTLRI